MQITETLTPAAPKDFRRWLVENGRTKKEIWLVLFKKASGKAGIPYEQAVEQALCFGWIDGMVKSLDAERYAQRFTPRRPGSHWTEANLARARRLIASGQMTAAGKAALPKDFK